MFDFIHFIPASILKDSFIALSALESFDTLKSKNRCMSYYMLPLTKDLLGFYGSNELDDNFRLSVN